MEQYQQSSKSFFWGGGFCTSTILLDFPFVNTFLQGCFMTWHQAARVEAELQKEDARQAREAGDDHPVNVDTFFFG